MANNTPKSKRPLLCWELDATSWQVESASDIESFHTVRLYSGGSEPVMTCDCKGYQYRGHCRHVDTVQRFQDVLRAQVPIISEGAKYEQLPNELELFEDVPFPDGVEIDGIEFHPDVEDWVSDRHFVYFEKKPIGNVCKSGSGWLHSRQRSLFDKSFSSKEDAAAALYELVEADRKSHEARNALWAIA